MAESVNQIPRPSPSPFCINWHRRIHGCDTGEVVEKLRWPSVPGGTANPINYHVQPRGSKPLPAITTGVIPNDTGCTTQGLGASHLFVWPSESATLVVNAAVTVSTLTL